MKYFIIFYLLLIIFCSCSSSNINNSLWLHGSWKQKNPKGLQYLAGVNDYYRFGIDSFYYSTHRFTDVGGIPCNPEAGDEYAKGIYSVLDNKIVMNGIWTDKTYTYPIDTGCYNKGVFEKNIYYTFLDKNTIIINPKNGKDFEYDEDKNNAPKVKFIREEK